MMNFNDLFAEIFYENNSNEYRICQKCFPVLLEKDSPEMFEQFFYWMEEYILNNETQLQDDEKAKIEEVKKKYNIFLDSILEKLVKEDTCKELFYEKLWNSIKNMPLCDDESDKAGILYILCRNDLIPYYMVEGIAQIEKEELWERIDRNQKNIIAARSIIRQYAIVEDRVSCALMLLKLFEQCNDDTDKAVIMSYIIRFIEINAVEVVTRQILEKIKVNH